MKMEELMILYSPETFDVLAYW